MSSHLTSFLKGSLERFDKWWFSKIREQHEPNYFSHKSFLHSELTRYTRELSNELLSKGHGGGNWRRLITSLLNDKETR